MKQQKHKHWFFSGSSVLRWVGGQVDYWSQLYLVCTKCQKTIWEGLLNLYFANVIRHVIVLTCNNFPISQKHKLLKVKAIQILIAPISFTEEIHKQLKYKHKKYKNTKITMGYKNLGITSFPN